MQGRLPQSLCFGEHISPRPLPDALPCRDLRGRYKGSCHRWACLRRSRPRKPNRLFRPCLSEGCLDPPSPRYIRLASWDIYRLPAIAPTGCRLNCPWHAHIRKGLLAGRCRSARCFPASRHRDIGEHTCRNSIPIGHVRS